MTGSVAEFDPERGLGVIETADGTRYEFHCVEIADGSRSIPIGVEVDFEPLPKLGRWEASDIRT